MNPCLFAFPELLLNHLGAYSRLETLAELPYVESVNILRKTQHSEPYHVSLDAHGLTLTLQCMNPRALPEEHQWGLQGMTLNAATWRGAWPTGLNPQEATADDVVALFALDPEEIMNMHPMLCFAIDGFASQSWSVMALFDTASKKLSSLSLIRVGPWRGLSAS